MCLNSTFTRDFQSTALFPAISRRFSPSWIPYVPASRNWTLQEGKAQGDIVDPDLLSPLTCATDKSS